MLIYGLLASGQTRPITMFVIVVLCLLSCANAQNYRISETAVPSNYEIDLFVPQGVFLGLEQFFEGKVIITFTVTNSSSDLSLHYRNAYINELSLTDSDNETNTVVGQSYDNVTEIFTITFEDPLEIDTEYYLNIEYSGTFVRDEMVGFYISTYERENGTTSVLVLTKFEPGHARHAFPCFDEPSFKATFKLRLTYPEGLNALGNTLIESNDSLIINDVNYVQSTYQLTTIMPTYLVAFAISEFTCTEGYGIDLTVPHRVCSRSEEAPYRSFAVEFGTSAMRAMESIFGIKFGSYMPKMDQLAIPDFASGAMENWGLVSYRETSLLWDEDNSSNSYKKSLAAVVAHEFSHSWFGNLVTCKWWDYIFLNEGFARFFQYFAVISTIHGRDWEMEKHFNVEIVQAALLTDSSTSASALTSPVSNPTEVSAKFDTISYSKGASILRMLQENVMGNDRFVSGMREYLTTNAQRATVPSDLWAAFASHVPSSNLPTGVTFEDTINNWIEEPGHPVVIVSKSGDDVVLDQERFLFNGNHTLRYYVPITYTTSADTSKFDNTTVKAWLSPKGTLLLSGVLNDSDWIILNNRQSGFYRVDYDVDLWTSIKTQLHSNHLKIDVLNRAQLISDAYNFARSGSTSNGYGNWSYSDVLDLLSYLKHEEDYYPWYAAIIGNNHLLLRIGYDSEAGQQFMSWMIQLMQNVYKTVPFDTIDDSNMVYSLKQASILNWLCKYGEETCVTKALDLFAAYRDKGVKVPKNVRTVVYCNALKYSEDAPRDFNFLWKEYLQTSLMTEVINLYAGLACVEDNELLKWYLGQTINRTSGIRLQDFTTVWSYVYSSSKVGTNAAIEYITENYQQLDAAYPSVGSLISSAASYINSEDQIVYLETLMNVTTITSDHFAIANSSLTNARSNMEWAAKVSHSVKLYLDSRTSGVAISKASVTIIVGIAFILRQPL
ncbi:membrane alanyl aminopeptidase-like [Euwallacea fornicatus]|uniref:membrane alanyl aminopeptidase-like n=1 Tax=Euwallacea fornicatus TaxID=995702 RepID=UPI00338F8CAE